jgi:hypothetical protein
LALPTRFLSASCDDAPETASENKFRNIKKRSDFPHVGDGVRRRGLATALLAHRKQRQPR